MDTCEVVCIEIEAAPGDVAPWLLALAADLGNRAQTRRWAIGPRGYSGPAAAPVAYETLALYSLHPHQSPGEGEVALAVTLLPLHRRRLALELRRRSPLPATLDTVMQHLGAHFAQVCTIVSGAASPQPHAGAPPLACNLWLDAQLAAPHAESRRLYAPWLEQYRALRGHYPADPRRSFRAAVAGSRRRIRRRTPHAAKR
jgi:hypothetical protein